MGEDFFAEKGYFAPITILASKIAAPLRVKMVKSFSGVGVSFILFLIIY